MRGANRLSSDCGETAPGFGAAGTVVEPKLKYITADTREEAMAAFKAEYERWQGRSQ